MQSWSGAGAAGHGTAGWRPRGQQGQGDPSPHVPSRHRAWRTCPRRTSRLRPSGRRGARPGTPCSSPCPSSSAPSSVSPGGRGGVPGQAGVGDPDPPANPCLSHRTQLLPASLLHLPGAGAGTPRHQGHRRWDPPGPPVPTPVGTPGC